ncbi:MAG TPA: 3-phytase [Bacteroidales bacterium]|nr:3-phytase [Bacteroidales bacterium]
MNDNKLVIFSVAIAATLLFGIMYSCLSDHKQNQMPEQKDSVVFARVETTPVVSVKGEDAADDPAVWINYKDPSKSLIIGTNKKGGLCVYKLNGEEIFYAPVGKVNNVDLRYGFPLTNRKADIIATTNRTYNTLQIFTINPETGELTEITRDSLKSSLAEVYGIALYKSKISHKYYAFIAGKCGGMEQWELIPTNDGGVTGKIVRKITIGSQSEGLVADDETGKLYVAEENLRIWRLNAEPDSGDTKVIVPLSDSLNPKISYDLEGLAIYHAKNGKGYLIASSQGNNSYAIFEHEGTNRYIGSFKIGAGTIDDVEETDGLDVCNSYLGDEYPNGIFIVQDGVNTNGPDTLNQNFKIVAWKDIANLFNPPLVIDTSSIF